PSPLEGEGLGVRGFWTTLQERGSPSPPTPLPPGARGEGAVLSMSDIPPLETNSSAHGGGATGWQRFFRRARDPRYLADRRRSFLSGNGAWEELTGFAAAAVLGSRCVRHRDPPPASLESLLTTLAPPPEALRGQTARVRRPLPRPGAAPDWWDITFLPFK